jgi:hypothetical protein
VREGRHCDQLRRCAAAVAADYPDVASLLIQLASLPPPPSDPRITIRRRILRAVWRVHFSDRARTPAASAIASAWAAWALHGPTETPPIPGSLSDQFGRLHRHGVRPLRARQIGNDLDASFG